MYLIIELFLAIFIISVCSLSSVGCVWAIIKLIRDTMRELKKDKIYVCARCRREITEDKQNV